MLNIQEYISSGIIESYVLGMASSTEQTEFEMLASKYPALKEARTTFEETMQVRALSNAIQPPAFLKQRIWEAIQKEMAASTPAKVISIADRHTPVRKFSVGRLAVAASIILVVACGAFLFNLYNSNKELEQQVASRKDNLERIEDRTRAIENRMDADEANTKQVKLVAPTQTIAPSINVFWDSTSASAYLVIKDLQLLPIGKQYHLWSVKNKKHSSLGLFDAPKNDDRLILKMDRSQDADSFVITVE